MPAQTNKKITMEKYIELNKQIQDYFHETFGCSALKFSNL